MADTKPVTPSRVGAGAGVAALVAAAVIAVTPALVETRKH